VKTRALVCFGYSHLALPSGHPELAKPVLHTDIGVGMSSQRRGCPAEDRERGGGGAGDGLEDATMECLYQ
jgi:hypothetical protein